MYIPKHFANDRLDLIKAVIDHNPLGMLIFSGDDGPNVSHLPFLFKPAFGSKGRLLAHMACANPQWQDFSYGKEVLVIFQGPHAHVSPTWYASSGVPT